MYTRLHASQCVCVCVRVCVYACVVMLLAYGVRKYIWRGFRCYKMGLYSPFPHIKVFFIPMISNACIMHIDFYLPHSPKLILY